MKIFCLFLSSLMGAAAAAAATSSETTSNSCRNPDMVLVEYPTSASKTPAIQKFFTDYGRHVFDEMALVGGVGGSKQVIAQPAFLRGSNLLCDATVNDSSHCMDNGNGRSWCSTMPAHDCGGGGGGAVAAAADRRYLQDIETLAITVDFTVTNNNFMNVTFAVDHRTLPFDPTVNADEIGACPQQLNLISTVTKKQILDSGDVFNYQEVSTCRLVNQNTLAYELREVTIKIKDGLNHDEILYTNGTACPDFNCTATSQLPADATLDKVILRLSAIDTRQRNLQEVEEEEGLSIPAEFEPEKYNCESKGNMGIVDAADAVSGLVFPEDAKPTQAQLIHCCLKN